MTAAAGKLKRPMALKFVLNTGGISNLCQVLHATPSGVVYDHIKISGSSGGTVTLAERDAPEMRGYKLAGTTVLTES